MRDIFEGFVYNPLLKNGLRGINWLLKPLRLAQSPVSSPKKILLSCGGHLGDVLLASCVIPKLKRLYPGVHIGFLVGTWAKPLVETLQGVDQIIICDHWKLNRSSSSPFSKYLYYLTTATQALHLLKKERYDWSIDLYLFFPSFASLAFKAGIPRRMGFASSGFSALLTDVYLAKSHSHVLAVFQAALSQWAQKPIASLFPLPSTHWRHFFPIDVHTFAIHKPYAVVHFFAGDPSKEVPLAYWDPLIRSLKKRAMEVIFTGTGEKERALIESHIAAEGWNAVDVLDISQLVQVITGAQLVITAETFTMHVAALHQVPTVVLYRQKPQYESKQWILSHPLVRPIQMENVSTATSAVEALCATL